MMPHPYVPAGLRHGGRVCGERRAQVTKARHGDDAEAARRERLAKFQSLVIATASAVNQQYWQTITGERMLDGSTPCRHHVAATQDAPARLTDVALIAAIGEPG